VDGEKLVEAITHLVRNAIRFTPDGGMVTLRAVREPERLVIEVEDTGIGISAERQTELFGSTVSIRDSMHHHSSNALEFNSAGLGLGIPIVRGIVGMHGGTLELTSAEGRGSVFRIVIPVVSDVRLEAA